MVYDYYSPVGGTSLIFYCIESSEQKPEKMHQMAGDASSLDGESSRKQ